jgi:hypothetical protein
MNTWIWSYAHGLSNFREPSVGTNNEICIRHSARVGDSERVFVYSFDWTPCLIFHISSTGNPTHREGQKQYIYNHAAAVKQSLAVIWKVLVNDVESLPGRLVEMCPKYSWTGPSNLTDLFFFDAVGNMRTGAHSRPMMYDFYNRCCGPGSSYQQILCFSSDGQQTTYRSISQASISG